jgi:hypothetical protein
MMKVLLGLVGNHIVPAIAQMEFYIDHLSIIETASVVIATTLVVNPV